MVLLFSVEIYAKGGGGSFNVNKLSSIRKFGISAPSKLMDNKFGADIIGYGEVNIRYRWWWLVRSWSSGSYATISLKQSGKSYKAKRICIEQGDVTRDNTYIIHHKTLCKKSVSKLRMGLDKYLGKVAVNFDVEGKSGSMSRIVYNDWIND
jgi:hypothetical protein